MPPTRRSGLYANALDALVPPVPASSASGAAGDTGTEPAPAAAATASAAGGVRGGNTSTVKLTANIAPEIADLVRDAVVALGARWTMRSVFEEALVREVQRLAEEHNDGKPFPSRGGVQPKTGRRVGEN